MQNKLLSLGAWVSCLLMLSTYFSSTLDGVATGLLYGLWGLSGLALNAPKKLTSNPVLLSAVLLFAAMAIGTTYSSVAFVVALAGLSKYLKLLVLVVLCDFLTTEPARQRMLNALFIASIISLMGSYLFKFDIIHSTRPEYFFKDRVDHGLFMAFFSFYCCHKIRDAQKYKLFYLLLVIACIHNLFFICTARIGQILFIMLMVLFSLQRLNKKHALLLLLGCLFFAALFLGYSEKNARFHHGFDQISLYAADKKDVTDISMHLRMTYWQHALTIIEQKPWLGHGTGSFAYEYQKIAKVNEALKGGTPHNEFLMITAQSGLPGLLLFLAFLVLQYRYAKILMPEYRYFAQGVLLTTVVASSLNPSFVSHVKGYWLICLIAISFSTLNTRYLKNA